MKQLKIGVLLSYLSIIISLLIGLIYTPILIRILGQSDYGLYSLVFSLTAYLTILDMGLGNSIVRFVARNREIGDKKFESNLVGQFLKFFSIISLITIIIGSILYFQAPIMFKNSLSIIQIKTAQLMILILTINYAVSFPLNVYSAVVKAYEKFIFLKLTNIIRILSIPIISIIVLNFGAGLVSLTLVYSMVNISILIIAAIYCLTKLNVKTTFSPIPKEFKKDIYFYSIFIFISAIADKIYWQTDQILLGIYGNPDVVAVYAVAVQLIFVFMSLSTAISNLFLPRLSRIVADDENIYLINEIYNKVSKYQYVIISLTFSGFVIFGIDFIHFWAGENFTDAYYIIIIIMIPFSIDLIQNLALMLMQAKGVYYFRAILMITCAILNLIISIPIIKLYGAYGTAIVTAIFIAISNIIILNFYFHIKLKLNMFTYWKNIVKYSVPVVILAVSSYVIKNILPEITNIYMFLLEILVYTILFAIISLKCIVPEVRLKIKKIFFR